MRNFKSLNRLFSLLLAVILVLSVAVVPVAAADDDITEEDTYIYDRDENGLALYMYQSPCMLGYDIDNQYGGDGVSIQAFVFTMYNTRTGEHFPTYCTDINVTAVQGADYRRMNLEDSPFSAAAAGQIRAILTEGFYIIPIDGESDDEHAARVAAKTAALGKAAGIVDEDGNSILTTGEAIAATQAAIWQSAHGSVLSFPNFCKSIFNPRNTKYGSLCSYLDVYMKGKESAAATIETVYKYLLSLEPIPATDKVVSGSSFVELNKPVMTKNADGTYTVTVEVTVNVDMAGDDNLTLSAKIGDYTSRSATLTDGEQTQTLTIYDVPADAVSGDVTLAIFGYQTAADYFYFDAKGDRGASQAMVAYDNSQVPVYAEVTAKENRVLNIQKTTKIDGAGKPLRGIVFDIFPMQDKADAGTLPENPTDVVIKDLGLAEYTVITDENGRATFDFTRQGLPDGVYLVVERNHPSIVAPIDPFYLYVPTYNPNNANADANGYVYNITVKPKNEVKASVDIEKDVISVGNDAGTVDAYAPHTWIIGTSIPVDISTGVSYVINDTLDNCLDYIGNLKVCLETVDGAGEPTELIADTDYTLTVNDVNSLSEGNPSDSFTVALASVGMTKIADTIGNDNYSNYILRVYFDAQINANAQMGTEIPNQAEVEYINAVNVEFHEESDIPVVYTGGINLLKVDAKNDTKYLPGATFEVYRPATQEELGANDEDLVTIPGVTEKVVKVSFFNNADWAGTKVDSATTDAYGKLAIYGLAYGKYYLLETKAPDGYSSLNGAVEVTVDASSHTEEKTVKIGNNAGVLLPATGGVGTTVFTVSGMTLVCIACFFLYLNKRKSIET